MCKIGAVNVCFPKVKRMSIFMLITGTVTMPRVPRRNNTRGIMDKTIPKVKKETGNRLLDFSKAKEVPSDFNLRFFRV